MNHPLFALPEEEFVEAVSRADAPDWQLDRFRQVRAGTYLPEELPAVLALWQSAVAQPDGFRWPWPSLAQATGPLPMGDLAVILAQTGSGKTTFTASLLNQLPPTTRALAFATEIPVDRYLSALAARRAGLHPDKVAHGLWGEAGWRMTEQEARQRHREAVVELEFGSLTIAPHLRLRASQLRDTLLAEAEKSCPSVVVVDHFQAITHDLRDGVAAVQATLELLQDFALRQYVTVIVTNQVHVRGQGGPAPRATDCVHLGGVFGGQALGQAASQILGVHRVLQDRTSTGIAITPSFLTEYRKGGGNESVLWDRTKVAIDCAKIRYDAHGNVGKEIRLDYRMGQYWEPGTHSTDSGARDASD